MDMSDNWRHRKSLRGVFWGQKQRMYIYKDRHLSISCLLIYLIKRERTRSPIYWVTPQIPAAAGTKPKPGAKKHNPGLSCGWQVPRHFSHHLLPPRVWINKQLESGTELAICYGVQSSHTAFWLLYQMPIHGHFFKANRLGGRYPLPPLTMLLW